MLDTDHEDYLPRELPPCSPPSVPFDFAEVDARLGAPSEAEADGVGVIEGLVLWLVQNERLDCRPGTLPRRMGIRVAALLWAMYPDRMPWAPGKALSEREVADALGVSRSAFSRAVVSIGRETGLRNALQAAHTTRAARRREARG